MKVEYGIEEKKKLYEYETSKAFELNTEECPLTKFQISKIVFPLNSTELSELDFVQIDATDGKLKITKFDEPMEIQIFVQAYSGNEEIPLWSDDKDYLISLKVIKEPNKPAEFKSKLRP